MKHVKICPRCGSTDITIPPLGLDFKMTFPDYCRNCNHRGNFPEIDIKDVKMFKKKLVKN